MASSASSTPTDLGTAALFSLSLPPSGPSEATTTRGEANQQQQPQEQQREFASSNDKVAADRDAGKGGSTSSLTIVSSASPQPESTSTLQQPTTPTPSTVVPGPSKNGNNGKSSTNNGRDLRQIKKEKSQATPNKSMIRSTLSNLVPTSNMVWCQVMIIVTISIGISTWLFIYLSNEQSTDFQNEFHISSNAILDQFRTSFEQKLNAIDTFATSITHTAITTNQTFPFVTIPNFSIRGSTVRVLADALMIHWLPLITDSNRNHWEEYALNHRYDVGNYEYEQDTLFRHYQDIEFGLVEDDEVVVEDDGTIHNNNSNVVSGIINGNGRRSLQPHDNPNEEDSALDPNVLKDGTNYHLRIYDAATNSVMANGTGPYLPIWQRTPMNSGIQGTLNLDFGRAPALAGVLPILLQDPTKSILNRVIYPIPNGRANFNANLAIGQYREDIEPLKEDPVSFAAYPVYDSFDPLTKQLVGVLSVSLYWKHYFTRATRSNTVFTTNASLSMMICVLENKPFNQTFAYEITGDGTATYLGEGDPINTKYHTSDASRDIKFISENINTYIQHRAGPDTRGYTTVPLHETHGQYTLRIHPSLELERHFITSEPLMYSIVVGCCFFILSSLIIFTLSRAVANEANAKTEKQLAAYLAHELRNPLSAIDSALQSMSGGGASAAMTLVPSDDEIRHRKESMLAIKLCTNFMTQLMNNILDARQLEEGNMVLHPRPMSLSALLSEVHQMLAPAVRHGVQWLHHCDTTNSDGGNNESQDWVLCDKHRYQQVITNVVTNAIRYTKTGSITLSIGWETGGGSATKTSTDTGVADAEAAIVNNQDGVKRNVIFKCVDTGPGIPKHLQERVFHRRTIKKGKGGGSSSGGGASPTPSPSSRTWGLAVTRLLVEMMGGTIWLESDPSVRPGTTCIVSIPMDTCEKPVRLSAASLFTTASTTPQQQVTPIEQHLADQPQKQQQQQQQQPQQEQQGEGEGRRLKSPRPSMISRLSSSYLPLHDEMQFLIVDDIKMNRSMLKRRLQKCIAVNAVVTEAATGEEALDIVANGINGEKRAFDVVIMDQFMEGAGGVLLGSETVKLMREKHHVDCLIIGCSANAVESDFEDAGADLFWGKPTPKNALIVEQIRSGVLAKRKMT